MRFKTIKILLTFFLLWITTQTNIAIENILAYILILSLGVLHGSNDLKLIRKFYKVKNLSFSKILALYILIFLTTFFMFLLLPGIGLVFFIIMSSYHFGEQHLASKHLKNKKLAFPVYILYGLIIFLMLFYVHSDEVIKILRDISVVNLEKFYFRNSLIFVLVLLFTYMIFVFYSIFNIKVLAEELLYLLLFYILFENSTLLWSFAIYFVVWHSLPSLKDQIYLLYGVFNRKNTLKYLKSSFLYWLISIIGVYLIMYFTKNDIKLFNLLFVALLAAITLPHTLILVRMHK